MTGLNLNALRVLVIDDHPPMRKIIMDILREVGIDDFAEADDGRTGIATLKDYDANVIFTDNRMSPMSGVELTRRIRAGIDGIDPAIPIIMVSAYTEMERIVEARDAGINEFLAKPISSKMVMLRLRSVVESPRPFVRSRKFFGPDRRRREKGPEGVERRMSSHTYTTPQTRGDR